MASNLKGVKVYIRDAGWALLTSYCVEIREAADDKVLAQSAELNTKEECREWIAAIKRVTKFTKVIDET